MNDYCAYRALIEHNLPITAAPFPIRFSLSIVNVSVKWIYHEPLLRQTIECETDFALLIESPIKSPSLSLSLFLFHGDRLVAVISCNQWRLTPAVAMADKSIAIALDSTNGSADWRIRFPDRSTCSLR